MSDSISNVTINPELFYPYDIARSQSPEGQPNNEELIPSELKEISNDVSSEFENITLDKSITSNAFKQSYVSSFVALEKPDLLNQASQKQILSHLESVEKATKRLLDETSTHDDPAQVTLASEFLAQNQVALAEAQRLYDLYYAPGAIHADQIQGYRRVSNQYSTQKMITSLQTVQYIAGMALVQPANQEDTTENIEADSGGLIPPNGDRVTQSRANYEAGKIFFTELIAAHLTNRSILPSIIILLREMGQFQRRGYQTQKDIAYRDQINAVPRAVRDASVAEKSVNGLFPNLLSNIATNTATAGGTRLVFANQMSYRPTPVETGLADELSSNQAQEGVATTTNNIPLENDKNVIDNGLELLLNNSLQESLKTIASLIIRRSTSPINASLT